MAGIGRGTFSDTVMPFAVKDWGKQQNPDRLETSTQGFPTVKHKS
jgi:hypothetical protein